MPQANDSSTTILLEVQGLCCADEERILQRKVAALDGVEQLDIDLIAKRLTVGFDPTLISSRDIIKAISETGMRALPRTNLHEGRRLSLREPRIIMLAISGFFTVVAFVVAALGAYDRAVQAFFILAIVSGGYFPARAGLSGARTLSMNINTLLILGVVGAVGLDLWSEAAVLVFVYSLGNVLETFVVKRARGAISSFINLMPREATVLREGREERLSTEALRIGDIVVVRPGEKIPIDGVVAGGTSHVDESAITGEPIPTRKKLHDSVFAGTFNQRGTLNIRATRLVGDTTLAKIIQSVESAQARKSRYQLFGERFGRIYTPAMFILGVTVATLPPLLMGWAWQASIYRALVVFVVSCSCGLALSVPVAIVAAVGNAARHGILVKGGICFERARRTRVIAFDKTGTLTVGRPRVTHVTSLDGMGGDQLLAVAASAEARSEHPLGQAIVRKAKEIGVSFAPSTEGFVAIPGRGVQATVGGTSYLVGNADLFRECGVDLGQHEEVLHELQEQGQTPVIVGTRQKIVGLLAIEDVPRLESRKTVEELKSQGLAVAMLTGDADTTARCVASQIGVSDVRSELSPEDKIAAVHALAAQYGDVMMVGDGINDSAALAASATGVAMGAAGTDVAMEAGDVVLLSDDLSRVPFLVNLSRRTVRNIYQNIFFSLLIIALLIPAALLGRVDLLSGLLINEGGALLVIANGLRMLK